VCVCVVGVCVVLDVFVCRTRCVCMCSVCSVCSRILGVLGVYYHPGSAPKSQYTLLYLSCVT
jgi:hypothetical protein